MDTLVTTLCLSLVRDALGQRTQYTHPNGMRTEYDYDSWNLPCSFPNWIWERDCTQNCILRPSVKSGGDLIMTAEREIEFQEQVRYEMQFRNEPFEPLPASTDAVLDSFEYTLNAGNEITRIDSADGSNWRYTYDDRGRLDYARWYSSGDTLTDYYDYTFDDGDNMTQYWRFNTVTSAYDTWDYAYNAANQQTSMTLNSGTAETRTYDDWGRLTARAQGSYSAAYSYRYGDRLRQVTSSFPGETATSPVYEYGGDGKMRRRGAEELKYGLGFNPINERTWLLAAKSFVYEPNKAVSERMAYFGIGFDGNQHYYNHDHLGSVRRTRSSAKGSLGVWDYEPFGKVHSGTATPLIFALHPYESGMGMHRAPYRNYSPSMARWTTVDPMGMVDGPNMYGYVGANPVNRLDTMGFKYVSVGDPGDAGSDFIVGIPCALAVGAPELFPEWFGGQPGNGGSDADHCRVACEIQKKCPGNMGVLAATLVEWIEYPFTPEMRSRKEIEAGEEGARFADNNPCVDCASECNSRFPGTGPGRLNK